MKNKIIKIAKDLEQDLITEEEARELLINVLNIKEYSSDSFDYDSNMFNRWKDDDDDDDYGSCIGRHWRD